MKKNDINIKYGGDVSVKNAELWYGDFKALKNVSIESYGFYRTVGLRKVNLFKVLQPYERPHRGV